MRGQVPRWMVGYQSSGNETRVIEEWPQRGDTLGPSCELYRSCIWGMIREPNAWSAGSFQ
jgi:hypothetical protein